MIRMMSRMERKRCGWRQFVAAKGYVISTSHYDDVIHHRSSHRCGFFVNSSLHHTFECIERETTLLLTPLIVRSPNSRLMTLPTPLRKPRKLGFFNEILDYFNTTVILLHLNFSYGRYSSWDWKGGVRQV